MCPLFQLRWVRQALLVFRERQVLLVIQDLQVRLVTLALLAFRERLVFRERQVLLALLEIQVYTEKELSHGFLGQVLRF